MLEGGEMEKGARLSAGTDGREYCIIWISRRRGRLGILAGV